MRSRRETAALRRRSCVSASGSRKQACRNPSSRSAPGRGGDGSCRADRVPLRDQGAGPAGSARADARPFWGRDRRGRARRARRVATGDAARRGARSRPRGDRQRLLRRRTFLSAHGDGQVDRAAAGFRRRADACVAERARAGARSEPSSRRRRPRRPRSGSRTGPSYTQVLVGPDGPRVGELAARLGGGHDAELCRVALGVDLNGARAVRSARRGGSSRAACARGTHAAARAFASSSLRRASCVRYRHRGGLCPGGDPRDPDLPAPRPPFRGFRRGADRAGAVLAVGDTREEALERATKAEAMIRFETDVEALV